MVGQIKTKLKSMSFISKLKSDSYIIFSFFLSNTPTAKHISRGTL